MRQISNAAFWGNVKESVGEVRYREIKEVFTNFPNMPQTPESFQAQVYSTLIPVMLEAARINGCKNVEAERAYQIEALEAYLEITREFPRLLTDPESITEEENERLKKEIVYPKYAEISNRFADGRLCHSHPIDGFTCYCDEKTA